MEKVGTTSADILCPWCGYNLRGLTSDRCPECGRDCDRAALTASLIPWSNRRHVGLVRAFLRTVAMATFRPDRLVGSIHAELSRRAAIVFFSLCILPVWGAIALPLISVDPVALAAAVQNYVIRAIYGPASSASGQIYSAPWAVGMATVPVRIIVSLIIASSLALIPVRLSQFSRAETERRERLITSAYYLCGALLGALICASAAACVVFGVAFALRVPAAIALVICFAYLVPLLTLTLWIISCARFQTHSHVLLGSSRLGFWVGFPLLLGLSLLTWLLLVPFTIGFVWFAIVDVR